MDSYRPEPPPDMRARTDTYPERPPRGPDRDRESSRLDLPTGPRAMDFSTTESAYSHRESRRGFPRPLPDGPFPNDGGSGYRGGDQHPVTEDDRFRQRDHDRRENGPRNRGEVLSVLLHAIITILTLPLDRTAIRHRPIVLGMMRLTLSDLIHLHLRDRIISL